MKNIIKTLLIIFVIVGGVILVRNNPTFATTSTLLNPSEVNTTTSSSVIYISTTRSAINISTTFCAVLYTDSSTEIVAEDVTIKYDNNKLKFLGLSDTTNGFDLLEKETTDSAVRLIIVSEGECNVINTKQDVIKLNFQSTTTGCAAIYIDNCIIADSEYNERKLEPSEIGGCIVKICCDVNGDGKFTLADIAIIAKHLGEKDGDTPQYSMDLVPDGVIDKKDLNKAKECLLNNSEYNNYKCN